ncbi:MAG: AAA family ATPase [Deltaproteobacteria bacterium]|nr:AAA family ATPase [Deltaproteobacteria bacterium]
MSPPSGLWPREKPRPTESRGEVLVWEALRRGLPAGWYAWHSVRVRLGPGRETEGDFVIVAPDRGLLVLEVKGGRIEVRDGRFFQNSRELDPPPRAQALSIVRALIDRLHAEACGPPAFGVATLFPETAFDAGPTQDDVAQLVLGEQDLPWLEKALPAILERACPPPREPRGPWIERLHRLWCERWTPKLALGHRAALDAERRVRLDEQQLAVLDSLTDNASLLVEGGAGTGKTLLAREAALRFAAEGKRVLLVCFTAALAHWLREQTKASGLAVDSVRGLAIDLFKQAGLDAGDFHAPGFWEDVPLRAASDALPKVGQPFDVIVVDEAQDFSENDWMLILELAGQRPLWAFHDPGQAFWPERRVPLERFPARFTLRRPYRCPSGVQALADLYIDRAADESAIRGAMADGTLRIVVCPSRSSVADKVALEIDKLLGEKLTPGDLAVLSVRGGSHEESIIRSGRLGRHALVRATDVGIDGSIVGDTFLRFKGLERPAIIITDFHLLADEARGVRMHIALTRALAAARVVVAQDDLARDPVLRTVLGRQDGPGDGGVAGRLK